MIHNIVTAIASRLNSHLKNRLLIHEDIVIVRNLVDLKGNISEGIENKVVVFLLSIEEEKIAKTKSATRVINNPIVILNANIMFAAHFPSSNYVESLRYMSLVIEFFQEYPVFNIGDTPGLPLNANRMHVELYNLNMPDTMRLWGAIGTKYLPSCAYKVKQIIFDSENLTSDIPPVMGD